MFEKDELIHLHRLFGQISNYYEARENEEIGHSYHEDLDADYANLGVRPTSIHMLKEDHMKGVYVLARDISSTMEESREETVSSFLDD